MPVREPSAEVKAAPRARKVSSVVWWSSTLEEGEEGGGREVLDWRGRERRKEENEGREGRGKTTTRRKTKTKLTDFISGFQHGENERILLAKSPLHLNRRLHPACFAHACSMWSKNPTPVHIQMCCEAVICDA